jgi:glycosyltransferase involved in cell wall biosynthesis
MTAPLVVMLSAAHPPDDVRVVRKEGAALAAAGWPVRHLCPGPAEATGTEVAGVAIETFPRRPGWRGRIAGIPALARRAAGSRAGVLHASEPDAWIAALLAGWRSGARVVLDVHEHYPSRLDGRLPALLRPVARAALRLVCRLAGRAADAVVVAKDGLARDFAAPLRTIAVRNYAPALPVAPRRHGPGPITLVHSGAMGRSRGWPQMLEALALAPPGTRLRLIGRFTDGSEEAFATRTAELGLSERVERIAWLPQEQALARLAECDIALVLFQPGETNHALALPHKLFDAMLAGLPVIAPAHAREVAGIVTEAGCGELVDTADPAAIATAIARLTPPGRRAALGAAGRRAALGRFGWAGEAERLVTLYRRLAPQEVSEGYGPDAAGLAPLAAGPGRPARL